MTGVDTPLRITTGEVEALGEPDHAQVSLVLSLLPPRLTGSPGSKSTWSLSDEPPPSDQIDSSSGDNFGKR